MAVKHKERSHAKLSASASHRWLACPPSAQICADLPDTATDYAKEGTCAHEFAEYKVNKLLGIDAADPTEHFTGECAGKILFESEGDSPQCGEMLSEAKQRGRGG